MLADRRAKIVATIGPSTRDEKNLEKAIKAGMNVARLNFSHGTHEDHLKVIHSLRKLSKDLKAPVTILQDLQGPKVRVGKLEGGKLEIKPGDKFTFTTEPILGRPGLIPSDFKELPLACTPGTRILLDDGLMQVEVLQVRGEEVDVVVIDGGILKDRKGMNLPGVNLPVDPMTPKDLEDLEFGIANKVDYIALSFVRHARDIRKLREIIEARGSQAKIVAKIEMIEAIENLEEICRLSDAVMVARGDLAVEVGQSRLPGFQKRIINVCNQLGRPVITATQMLESMIENPRPTRAEITDVANAVLDGSDALMLSAESASGKNPFKAIRTMHEIILEVERNEEEYYKISLDSEFLSTPAAIAASASLSALKLNATAIICLTSTGKTASIISSFRPKARIISVTQHHEVLNSQELSWGIQTHAIKPYKNMEDILSEVDRLLVTHGLSKTGDKVIVTLGQPISSGVKTNSLYVHTVGAESLTKLPDAELPLRCQNDPLID
ncbi:pyruvate kinase [Bdellovibrio sp. SKB1291214]|uniref:pyruvate kinase n=1 Tax=Bdellovibrio sp. SKB1291214 TaxID=1732569 RepID=UPI000B517125|nr:pyruvate kinase [Bdellovibrio sp. SKB1291214]UYL08231.1 pyruvate kinase [Bdellovibrio sp. SKB1291214]